MGTTRKRRRGVGWVLRQAAVLAVLGLVAVHLGGVAWLTASHRNLTAAAKRAAAEAKLPKASLASVEREASRVLGSRHEGAVVAVSVYRRPGANRQARGLHSGDRVTIRITSPAQPLLPSMLARLAPWLARENVFAEAQSVVP